MADDGARSGPGTESGALQRAEQRLASLQNSFGHMVQGLAVFGPDQRLVLRNDRFDKLLSLPPEKTGYADAVGFVAAILRETEGGAADAALRDRLLEHAAAGKAVRFEVRAAGGNWLQIKFNPTVQSDLVITVTDITPLKNAEAEQRTLREETTRARQQMRDAIEAIS